jgi:hypothetical protein
MMNADGAEGGWLFTQGRVPFGPSVALKPPAQSPALFHKKKRFRIGPIVLVLVLIAGGFAAYRFLFNNRDDSRVAAVAACDVPLEFLERIANGYYARRSGDVLALEQEPHQFGTRHPSAYPYNQDVPIVLYGPGFIRAGETSERAVTVADLAPTFAELLDFDFPERDGRVLEEALLPKADRNGMPRLIFTLVWDGGGDNVLEQWPDEWPNLKDLIADGSSYSRATVGSAPSITPAIHSTIGTGSFPSGHGQPDTKIRVRGKIIDAWEKTSPRYLKLKTLADLFDVAHDNAPLIGLHARDSWHLGMIGHGAYLQEGDHDIAVLDRLGAVEFRTNPDYYSMPPYAASFEGLDEAIEEVDLRDGSADRNWLGNPLLPFDGSIRQTPAWSIFQSQKIIELLTNEGFGTDEVPDLFYTNYKATDLAGHAWNMVEPEERDNLAEQDRQLPVLLETLDELVGRKNYVLALTADHGQTPYPRVGGGWAIETPEMTADIERRFDTKRPKKHLVLSNRGYQIFLSEAEMRRNRVTAEDVSRFVRNYHIGENRTSTNRLLRRFEGREDERLFLTAVTPDELQRALECARSRRLE